MTNEQFNTLIETIKQGFKQVADASDTSFQYHISGELESISKSLRKLSADGIDVYEQNNGN